MKKSRVQLALTALLLFVLAFLLTDSLAPLRAAKVAICGYGSCIVTCEGENCDCGHVGPDYVSCHCDDGLTIKWCS